MLYLVAVCSEHSTAAINIFESGSSFCTPAKLVRGRSTASALLLEGVALRLRRLSEVSRPVVRVGCAARAAGAGSCTICGSFLPGSLTPGSPQLAHVSHKPTIGQTFQGGSCEHGPSGSRVFFLHVYFFHGPTARQYTDIYPSTHTISVFLRPRHGAFPEMDTQQSPSPWARIYRLFERREQFVRTPRFGAVLRTADGGCTLRGARRSFFPSSGAAVERCLRKYRRGKSRGSAGY